MFLHLPESARWPGAAGVATAKVRLLGLELAGERAEAAAFAERRAHATHANTGTRVAMATWLVDHGEDQRAMAIVGEPIEGRVRPAERRGWQLAHARAARSLGRYGEARSALDALQAEHPDDGEAQAERTRVEQIEERYSRVPVISMPRAAGSAPHGGRVLHLVESSLRDIQSGYTIRTHQVALAQRRAGMDPHVLVVGSPPHGDRLHERVDDVDYHWLPGATGLRRGSDVSWDELARRAARLVDELLPEVLHAATPPTVGNFGRGLARWSGLPLVYEVRGFRDEFWLLDPDDDGSVDHAVLSRRADTDTMREAGAMVTLGEQMRAEVVARGVDAGRVSIVPNAVDTTRFRPGPRDAALAARYGFGRDDVVIGYISSFQPYEDFQTLVDAIAVLRAKGRRVRGLLAGDGPTFASIQQQVASLGLDGLVAMPGKVPHDDLPRHHRLIDVFVVPRLRSRFTELVSPLKALEALASGRAVVAARLDAVMESISDGRTGLSYQPGNAADLASVLERLVLDPGERQRLGEAARRWVEQERTLDRNGARYREIYKKVARGVT